MGGLVGAILLLVIIVSACVRVCMCASVHVCECVCVCVCVGMCVWLSHLGRRLHCATMCTLSSSIKNHTSGHRSFLALAAALLICVI